MPWIQGPHDLPRLLFISVIPSLGEKSPVALFSPIEVVNRMTPTAAKITDTKGSHHPSNLFSHFKPINWIFRILADAMERFITIPSQISFAACCLGRYIAFNAIY